ncbi:MAG: beta-hydroxyacyl-ACP dehydratase [Planctomycetes bacterium]|nr:beta-hydroxyacyl-ACP dehydratase [Planctomycetota bacterium]
MRWFWIDRFTEFVCGSHAVAVKGVSLSEDHLHDHMVGYPIMPNSLVVEGMAQAGGLLVSESYGFGELVVLGKLAKVKFYSCVRTGETLTYRVRVDTIRDDGAAVSGTAHVGDRLHAKALLFFARLGDANETLQGQQLFRPSDLRHWLSLVGIFEVGVHPDGTRMKEKDYPLEDCSADTS